MPEHDVWGELLADELAGKRAMEIVERDDGYMMAFDAGYFIAPFKGWDDPVEQRAMRFVRGRVLDVGCGGGRVCLYLQERGFEVVGIDSSPGAIECRLRRGVRDARALSIDSIDAAVGQFDTIVFLGQNFEMLGSRARARRLLARLAHAATSRGRIVAETFDPHTLDEPAQKLLPRAKPAPRAHARAASRAHPPSQPLDALDRLASGFIARARRAARRHWLAAVAHAGRGPGYVAIIDRTR